MLVEQGLGFGLRNEKDEWETRVAGGESTERYLGDPARLEMQGQARAWVSASDQRFAKAETLQDLERTCLDRERARLVRARWRAVYHSKIDAERLQLCGERKSSRACADDQYANRARW